MNFLETYEKQKETQEDLKKLLNNLIDQYEQSLKKEQEISQKIDEILLPIDENSSNQNQQVQAIRKYKNIKEYRQLLNQLKSKQSMLLRNITELSKSQVDQPKTMQDIIQMKEKLIIDGNNPMINNPSVGLVTFQDMVKIGEQIISKKGVDTNEETIVGMDRDSEIQGTEQEMDQQTS